MFLRQIDEVRDVLRRVLANARRDLRGLLLALERLGLTPKDVEVRLSHRVAIGRMLGALGVPAEKWGETVKALVVLRPGASADEVVAEGLPKILLRGEMV
jgi:acyl-CoA synthetase (AMP-forming)/AMP-acid ligase II